MGLTRPIAEVFLHAHVPRYADQQHERHQSQHRIRPRRIVPKIRMVLRL